ncbi:MAG: hypothetical protein V3S25_10235 [Nitrospirales bacterium]
MKDVSTHLSLEASHGHLLNQPKTRRLSGDKRRRHELLWFDPSTN